MALNMLVKVVGAGVPDLIKLADKLLSQRDGTVEVPKVISDDFRLTLEQAESWLIQDGLTPRPVLVNPDIAYKDCSDREVVATNYKLGKKVKTGTPIILQYVTAEVIDASKKLYEESEKEKINKAQKKDDEAKMKADKKAEELRKKAEEKAEEVRRKAEERAEKILNKPQN